jgi:hypothetical protein
VALNPRGSFTLDLSLFGSLVEDINPTDLPPGASPDNAECFFLPGGVFTRPALIRALPTAIGTRTIVSVKEFPVPTGDYLTVFLDSAGFLHSNDPVSPASNAAIGRFTPGVQFKAENFGGKQWYAGYNYLQSAAFSQSPFVGVDVPRYFNGQTLRRVNSDAPGAPPAFNNLNTAPLDLVASAIHGSISIDAVVSAGEQTGPPTPGPNPAVLQQGTSIAYAPAETNVFTFPLAVQTGNSVFLFVDVGNQQILNITDSQGNAYTRIAHGQLTSQPQQYAYLAQNIGNGTLTVTVTMAALTTPASGYCAIAYHELAGLVTPAPLDAFAANTQALTAPPSSFNTGTVTTSNANDWIFSYSIYSPVSLTSAPPYPDQVPPAGYTVSANVQIAASPSSQTIMAVAYQQVSTAGSYSPTWNASILAGFNGLTVALKVQPAGSTPVGTFWTELVYTCLTPVPTNWLNSSITVTGFPSPAGDIANLTSTIVAINGDTFTVLFTTNTQINSTLASAFATGTVASSSGNYMTRQGNIVTAYVGSESPADAFLDVGFWISILNANNSLVQGPSWNLSLIQRDVSGLVTVTIDTQLSNLPVGASLYIAPTDTADFPTGYQTVYQVLSSSAGHTVFTFTSLNAVAAASSAGGSVHQTWSPAFGTYGNAAQITAVGFDPDNGWFFQFAQLGPDAVLNVDSDPNTPQARVQAQAAAGPRNAVVMFASDDGAITAPSIPVGLAVSGGTSLIQATNIPIGPPGTVRRIIAFTPAEGAHYYYISPVTIPQLGASAPIVATGTVIDDNVTTSAVLDFSDTQLTDGTQIDIAGNNLFNQVVLAPCLGVIEYQGRLAWWGEINNIKNFLNMTMDGGYVPLVGTVTVTAGSATVAWATGSHFNSHWAGAPLVIAGVSYTIASVTSGTSLKLTVPFAGMSGTYAYAALSPAGTTPLGWSTSAGDGAGVLVSDDPANAFPGFSYLIPAGTNSLIEQGCATDVYGAPILAGATAYFVRLQAAVSALGGSGALVAQIFSPSQGPLATASFPISSMTLDPSWYTQQLSASLPTNLPADAKLRFYGSNTTVDLTIDELELIPVQNPVSFDQMRLSYVENPFAYDSVSGVMSVTPSEPIVGAFRQRGYLYILSDQSLFQSQNNGTTEPDGWSVVQYSAACGASGPNAVDFAEDVAYWAGRYGGRAFVGDPSCKKITQELAPTWESINWTAQTTIWVKNDPVQRMLYFGIPVGNVTNVGTAPTQVLAMSYRLSDAAYNVPDPVHVSQYSGRLICTDLGRRWSRWNLPLTCGDMCARPQNNPNRTIISRQMTLGGGNGVFPGGASGFGELYTLDIYNYPPLNPPAASWNCVDADYGGIASYYVTYFFFAPDVEQQPILSLHRKLFNYLTAHITGVGKLQITPYVDALSNSQQILPLTPTLALLDTGFDYEWHPLVRGNRVAFRIRPQAVAPSLSAAMAVTHLIVSGRRDMIFPVRGSVFGP